MLGLESRLGRSVLGNTVLGDVAGTSGTKTAPSITISISPTSSTINRASTQQFIATTTLTGGGTPAVEWLISPSVGSITQGGFYTGPNDHVGDVHITVTAQSLEVPTTTATSSLLVHPKSLVGCFFTASGSLTTEYLRIVESDDATDFSILPIPTNWEIRDPSIVNISGTWYVAYTGVVGGFGILSSTDLVNWSTYASIVVPGTFLFSAAPEWFIDSDGSIHIIFCGSTTSSTLDGTSDQQIWETHPSTSGVLNGSWSTPAHLYGNTVAMGSPDRFIDPCIRIRDSAYDLVFKNQDSFNNPLIQYTTATALLGTYGTSSTIFTSSTPTNLWEGPCILQIGTNWFLYVDNYMDNTAHNGAIYYLESTNDWSTWSSPATITSAGVDLKHGTVITGPIAKVLLLLFLRNWTGGFQELSGGIRG